MNRIITFFILFSNALTQVVGQSYYAKVVGEEMGFGQERITHIMEDQQGFLWIGTYLGLFRYDGLQSVIFKPEKDNPNSMSSEFIYQIYEDKSRNLWVATRNGLTRIDPTRKIFTRYKHDSTDPNTIPNNRIFNLSPSSDSTLFLSCDRSPLCEFNMNTGLVERLNPKFASAAGDTISDIYVRQVYEASNKTFLVNTSRGILELNRNNNTLTTIQDSISGYHEFEEKQNYFKSKEGAIWFTNQQGHICKWLYNKSVTVFKDSIIIEQLRSGLIRFFEFNSQFLLISSLDGYILMDKESGKSQPFYLRDDQEGVLQPKNVNACCSTRSGIVVLGLLKGAMLIIDPLQQHFQFRKIFESDPLSIQKIGDVKDDPEHHMRYISITYDTVFYTEDLITGEIESYPKPPGSGVTNKWFMDQSGRLWLSCGSEMLEINRQDQSVKSYSSSVPAYELNNIIEIAPGKLLIGSFRDGLYQFEPDNKVFEKIPETKGWVKTQVFCLKYDEVHQCVWIGTVRNGLLRYDLRQDTFIQYEYHSENPKTIGGDWVRDITIDSMGYVWFATDPIGLSRFDFAAHPDSAFINFSMEDGLPTSHIGGMVTDKNGKLWMSSLNGVATMDPVDFSIKVYGKEDGMLQTASTNANVTMSANHRVMVKMDNGYYSFSPKGLMSNIVPPDLVIHDILVFDQSTPLVVENQSIQPIELSYKENFLTVLFSVMNLTESEKNTVRYRMTGLEQQWNTRQGISQIRYTNIPPGKYVFQIRAANNDGIWSTEETQIEITIRPPFWQRTWFYFIIGAILAGILGAFYNYKLKQSIQQNKLRSEKETLKAETGKQLAQLEMTALRAQMNPHFIFNCLNSINRFIIVNDNDTASEYLTKFAKLIRQVLDNSRGDKTLLSTEIETLKLYIEMESLRFNNKFEYALHIDPALNQEEYLIQPMLIQPYVENAIWHGLMHRKEKGILNIEFSKRENSLLVEITDNGVGRAMAKQIKESQLITKKSHGMKVTAERMSLLSKKLNVPVEALIEDLYDEEQYALGTRVKLTLPLERPMPNTTIT